MNLTQLAEEAVNFLGKHRDEILTQWKQLALSKWNVRQAQHSFLGDRGSVRGFDGSQRNAELVSVLVDGIFEDWVEIIKKGKGLSLSQTCPPPTHISTGPYLTLTYLMDVLLTGKETISEALLHCSGTPPPFDCSDAILIYERLMEAFADLTILQTQRFCSRCMNPIQEAKDHITEMKKAFESHP